jgi:hypothetical protein
LDEERVLGFLVINGVKDLAKGQFFFAIVM